MTGHDPLVKRSSVSMNQTIQDFGEQWVRYRDNEGYYGSLELFSDILSPFLTPGELKGCKVGEIGSGTGRIVNMLLEAGVNHVVAVEPSDAFYVLRENIRQPDKVKCLKTTGDQLPAFGDLDYVFSIGVLHHIQDPIPAVEAAFKALHPGGHFFVWVYGKEGNSLYLTFLMLLRMYAKHLPHVMLTSLVEMMYWPLVFYMKLCHVCPLPLREYLFAIFEKMSPQKRRLVIYDQLNPSFAKYYTGLEVEKLLLDGNFKDVRVHHRHGYSWTAIGTKPQR